MENGTTVFQMIPGKLSRVCGVCGCVLVCVCVGEREAGDEAKCGQGLLSTLEEDSMKNIVLVPNQISLQQPLPCLCLMKNLFLPVGRLQPVDPAASEGRSYYHICSSYQCFLYQWILQQKQGPLMPLAFWLSPSD